MTLIQLAHPETGHGIYKMIQGKFTAPRLSIYDCRIMHLAFAYLSCVVQILPSWLFLLPVVARLLCSH